MVDHPFSLDLRGAAGDGDARAVRDDRLRQQRGRRRAGRQRALEAAFGCASCSTAPGVRSGATQIVGHSFDGWTAGFPTAWLDDPDREALVAVAMNGDPLPAEHGYPARLIVPGLYGYVSATKWLAKIGLTTLEAFNGYWVPLGWAKEAPILTQSRIDVPKTKPDGQGRAGAGRRRGLGAGSRGGRRRGADRRPALGRRRAVDPDLRRDLGAVALPLEPRRRARTSSACAPPTATGAVQTDQVTRPAPDGARGHHTISVTVEA